MVVAAAVLLSLLFRYFIALLYMSINLFDLLS